MKVSRKWLQKFFDTDLPEGQELADLFTFHSFEVDEQEGDLLDLKVLPDRAGYALSHRGVASELAAALQVPLKEDPLREPLTAYPESKELHVAWDNTAEGKVRRYIGAAVHGVKVGPSPAWLKEALESVGQRSINNVVDATNYVMLNIGQPLHAFDAGKMGGWKESKYFIDVRSALGPENITVLGGDEYTLDEQTLVIGGHDKNESAVPLGIAGIKGGAFAEVDASTTDIVVEAANFDGPTTRRTAQKLKLFTDASLRFQNRPSPELAAYGMRDVLALIQEIAGGEVEGVVDVHPNPITPKPVSITLGRINSLLGSSFSTDEVHGTFERLGLSTEVRDERFTVTPPFERTDLVIPEDLVEEVGRVLGYDRLPATQLPLLKGEPDQARFRGTERMKDQLVEQGFIEVSTQSFAKKGDIVLANPLDKKMPALRTSLRENLGAALAQARHAAPLVLAPGQKPKLFEVGAVFPKVGEHVELRMTETVKEWGDNFPTVDNLSEATLEEYGKGYTPKRYKLGPFKPFSQYPFIVRDVAAWAPDGKTEEATREFILKMIVKVPEGKSANQYPVPQTVGSAVGPANLVRMEFLDRFEKDGRTSYAYRLVFQSFERTLTDEEANAAMETVAKALSDAGYEVR